MTINISIDYYLRPPEQSAAELQRYFDDFEDAGIPPASACQPERLAIRESGSRREADCCS